MSESTETVFVTKYALTDGIRVMPVAHRKGNTTYVRWPERVFNIIGLTQTECHATREAAVTRAEEMRRQKLAGLKRQIAKLETKVFA